MTWLYYSPCIYFCPCRFRPRMTNICAVWACRIVVHSKYRHPRSWFATTSVPARKGVYSRCLSCLVTFLTEEYKCLFIRIAIFVLPEGGKRGRPSGDGCGTNMRRCPPRPQLTLKREFLVLQCDVVRMEKARPCEQYIYQALAAHLAKQPCVRYSSSTAPTRTLASRITFRVYYCCTCAVAGRPLCVRERWGVRSSRRPHRGVRNNKHIDSRLASKLVLVQAPGASDRCTVTKHLTEGNLFCRPCSFFFYFVYRTTARQRPI